MMLPVALIQRFLGIELHGHEALDVGPAAAKATRAAQMVRERVRRPLPAEVRKFAAHAYPDPTNGAELPDADTSDDEPGDESTVATATQTDPDAMLTEKLGKAMDDPRLPAGVRERLIGQRPGKTCQTGLRNQHAPVRSYVPSLI